MWQFNCVGVFGFFVFQDQFISVLIKNGRKVFRYKLDSETPEEVEGTNIVNDGMYQQVCNFKDSRDHYFKKYTLTETLLL